MKKIYTTPQSLYFSKSNLLILLLLLQSFCSPLYANTYNVNTTVDGNSSSGTVNLRGAITAADNLGGTHTINVPAGTYNLTLGTISFGNRAENITITGAGSSSTIINMTTTGQDRIFFINPPGTIANVQTTITGIQFSNGVLTGDNYGGGAILAGGPSNTNLFSNCTFTNNSISNSQTATPGGALRFSGGGTFTISNCTFTGNNNPKSDGGALRFDLQSGEAGSLTVTNSVFTNNSVPGSGSQGGAISLGIAGLGSSSAFSCNITGCTFTGNKALGTGGAGGAMSLINSNAGSTANINYNRFYNNTATNTNRNAVAIAATSGNVNLSNNWWGCNGGPTGCADQAGLNASGATGTNTLIPYLQLRTITGSSSVCTGSSVSVTSDFTINSAGSTISTTNLSAFSGFPVNFTATSGTVSPNSVNLVNGVATTSYTGSSAGAGTVTGTTDNAAVTANLTVNAAPSVTSPGNATVCAGNTTTLSATGSGSGTLSYQWYKGVTALSNNTNYSGVTTSTLTISNANTSLAGTDYYVKVFSTTGCGPTNSNNATLTVNALPAITDQPDAATTCVGMAVTFAVVASGSGTLSYQWYKGTIALVNTSTGSMISGATTATLTIGNPGTADAGTDYNVKVFSTTFCTAATSTNATLTVNALPAVTSQPASTTTCTGIAVNFSVTASGSGTLSYQWYKGNTALMNGASGSGSAYSGVTTATLTISNPGNADAAINYNVKVSSITGCTPATSNNASLTVNTPLSISSQPASASVCTGEPAVYSVAASGSGTLSYQWYKGTTALSNGTISTGAIVSGATTATLTISNASISDNASNYNVIISSGSGCPPVTSGNASLTAAPPTTPTSGTRGNETISSSNTIITDAGCNILTTLVPSGASPLSGNVFDSVTITANVQMAPNGSPYVRRHYDILPASNAATATATVTLYFTQADFTTFNAYTNNANGPLPVNAADAANNKANIRIYQFHGTGFTPGSYSGTSVVINPDDNLIVWNNTYSRWEITFPVTGFSGFYLADANSLILPLNLLSFTGYTDGSNNLLNWKTSNEKDLSYFEIERSPNATNFMKVGQVNAGSSSYSFTDKPAEKTVYYYRLKIVDRDGKYTYSETVAISLKKAAGIVQVLPNPFTDKLMINISAGQASDATLRLTDMSGKTLVTKTVTLQAGTNAITMSQLGALAKGTYLLQVLTSQMQQSVKVLKAD